MTLSTPIAIGADITGLTISSQKGDGTNAVLSGGGSTRLLEIESGAALLIVGVDFEDGRSPSSGSWQEKSGGCVLNYGDLQTEASNFRDCVSSVSRRVLQGGGMGRPTTTLLTPTCIGYTSRYKGTCPRLLTW